jgi:superfamily II DNA or RNA helicase
MKSKLSNKGYVIIKDEYSDKELKKIKKELNVSPYSPYQSKFSAPPSFPIYLESKRKLYLPRYWSLDNLGPPEKFCINEGTTIDIKFNGSLRPVQEEAVSAYMKNCYPEYGGGILCLQCGGGKSLGRDTPVIMYDGTIKMIQDVKIGDQLMGDDSTPRNVINLGRGMEMMYDIVPTKGDTYTVNESHILSLKYSTHKNKNVRKGDVIDIPLKDYMNLPPSYHGRGGNLLGYRVGVDFPYKEVDIDPYFLGYWLGDGTCSNTQISTIEECVVDYCYEYAEELNQQITQGKDTYDDKGNLKNRHSIKYTICGKLLEDGSRTPNKLLMLLKGHNLIGNKHIPHIYKCNSREIRLQLLAGILDSDGSAAHSGYDIIQKNERLLDDIIYLARSLGFACYKKECKKSCMYNGEKKEGTYYRTNIHGKGLEEIPVKCERKKVQPRRQIKDALTTRIKVVPKGVDYYYGVELDGNHRYLLGSFTVTHNTVIGLNIASQLKKKTLIIVHKEFLLNQWIERIKMFLPDAQVGRIQAKTFDIAGKDIVIGMLQSLSMKEFEENAFDSFGTVIVDECFVGDTLIYTSTGLRTIEYLYNEWKNNSNTTYILSYNKKTGLFENKKMTFGWKKTATNLLEINISDIIIKCTSNHKILTNEGYIEAKNLDISKHIVHTINNMNEADDINKIGKNIKYIKNIENVENIYVYDIEVEDNHNYIVTDNDHSNNYTRTHKGFIVSNCHHISSEVFSRSLPKVSFKYTIGLTATPNRTDGLTKVFEWFLGPIVYRSKGGKQHNVFVKVIQIDDTNESYCKVEEGYDGKPITSRMINNVANYIPRTSVIIREVQKIMEEPGRKMLILSDRRDHLKYIHTQLTEKGFDVGFYVGGMKQKDLDISETKPIILGTFSMSSEALDIPELNTLFMTTPKSNIEQSVGRILRKTHEIRPLIIDIKDNFRPFVNQCNKRKAFYKKCKYEIYEIKIKPNEMEEILEKNKNIHNMTCNIIDDLNETEKSNSKKKGEQIKIEECMFSDDD